MSRYRCAVDPTCDRIFDSKSARNGHAASHRLTQQKLIDAIEALARHWPKDFWIGAYDGRLFLIRYGPGDAKMVTGSGCLDQDFIVHRFSIPCDGGGL